MHPRCPVCKKMCDLSKPHVIVNDKDYHPECGIKAIQAGKAR